MRKLCFTLAMLIFIFSLNGTVMQYDLGVDLPGELSTDSRTDTVSKPIKVKSTLFDHVTMEYALGWDFAGSFVNVQNKSGSMVRNNYGFPLCPSIEATLRNKRFIYGLGFRYQVPRMYPGVEETDYQDGQPIPKFGFCPAYLTGKYAIPFYDGLDWELSADIGYGLFYGNRSFTSENDLGGGIYWGLASAWTTEHMVYLFKYTSNNGSLSHDIGWGNRDYSVKYDQYNVAIGYRKLGNPLARERIASLKRNLLAISNFKLDNAGRDNKICAMIGAQWSASTEKSQDIESLMDPMELKNPSQELGLGLTLGYSNLLQLEYRHGWRRTWLEDDFGNLKLTRQSNEIMVKFSPFNLSRPKNKNCIFLVMGAGLASMKDINHDGWTNGKVISYGLEYSFFDFELMGRDAGAAGVSLLYDITDYGKFSIAGYGEIEDSFKVKSLNLNLFARYGIAK